MNTDLSIFRGSCGSILAVNHYEIPYITFIIIQFCIYFATCVFTFHFSLYRPSPVSDFQFSRIHRDLIFLSFPWIFLSMSLIGLHSVTIIIVSSGVFSFVCLNHLFSVLLNILLCFLNPPSSLSLGSSDFRIPSASCVCIRTFTYLRT